MRRRNLLLVLAGIALVACLYLVSAALLSGLDRGADDDAADQAERIARSAYVFAGSYVGDRSPTNAEVADHLAAGTGVSVPAREVHNPDKRGVGVLATVDVVLTARDPRWFGPPEEVPVCVRFTVERAETGPREIRHRRR